MSSNAQIMVEALLSAVLGLVLGTAYFAGLWWTVARIKEARNPAMLMVASLVVRGGIMLGGLWFLARGGVVRLAACLLGVIAARVLSCRALRPPREAVASSAGS